MSRLHYDRTISPHDDFLVCNRQSGKVVQGNQTKKSAQHAVDILNDHEDRNHRDQVYYWRKR